MNARELSLDAVVVGCGIVGITTALALRATGRRVEVWTRDDPLATTSAAAGAIWYPFLAEPRDRCLSWGAATFRRLAELAIDPASGVSMRDVVEVFDRPDPDLWWRDAVGDVEMLAATPTGHVAAVRLRVPVCDVPVLLRWLLAELDRCGVPVVRRALADFGPAFERAPLVANCSGLGARELCADRELYAVRGQVEVLVGAGGPRHAAFIDDTGERPRYVIARADSLVLGGTAQQGDERLAPDPGDTAAILAGLEGIVDVAASSGRRTVVGLRPCRATVRLECEPLAADRLLVHNYGHGGSGYTLAWGCADEVVRLVDAAR